MLIKLKFTITIILELRFFFHYKKIIVTNKTTFLKKKGNFIYFV